MRTALLGVLGLLILVQAAPRLKNLYLHTTYAHGADALVRTAGRSGQLAGIWEGTFDDYPCGIDTRLDVQLVLDEGGYGHLTFASYGKRLGILGAPMAYSWASILPFDREDAYIYSESVRDSSGILIIHPDDPPGLPQYVAYRMNGDRLLVAYVREPGEEPERWGAGFSGQAASIDDLLLSR